MQRRQFLTQLSGASVLASAGLPPLGAEAPRTVSRPVLRVAHLTDTHVLPDRGADLGLTEALRHAQAQKPDLVLFGGDLIMDALKKEKDDVLGQWAVWDRVIQAELKTPHRVCLGNHDIWGWGYADRPDIATDRHFGKTLAMERLALADRHYSFDQAGWHFIVLDSMQLLTAHHTYTARLDEDQFSWLARDLAAVAPTTPVCVLSHIPILAACAFFDGENEKTGTWTVPGAWMHLDARRIKTLFHQHPNVKVCLSGHIHLADDVSYLGVRYLCNGAVCGGWWKGPCQEFAPAYALVDFFADGTVENRLVFYRGSAPVNAAKPA